MPNNVEEKVGINKEFAVATISDVTIWFNGGVQGKTSANDTATKKYTNNYISAHKFFLRNDQTVRIVSINGMVFTDPTTVILNKGHKEEFDSPFIFKMTIKTTVVNTNIKLRAI